MQNVSSAATQALETEEQGTNASSPSNSSHSVLPIFFISSVSGRFPQCFLGRWSFPTASYVFLKYSIRSPLLANVFSVRSRHSVYAFTLFLYVAGATGLTTRLT